MFVLEAGPYYEAEEDKYIQQLTKMVMNVGGIPGNWADPVGLPTEIVPLDKPYTNWVGGVFRGQVLSDGAPVANAEIEIEYMNHPPDIAGRRFADHGTVVEPHASFATMGIRANDRGEFMIGLPRAGCGGLCAGNGSGDRAQRQGTLTGCRALDTGDGHERLALECLNPLL